MSRRIKGKQLAKHLQLTGSLSISGSDSTFPNSASIDVTGGINVTTINQPSGIIDCGTFYVNTITPIND